MDIELSQLTAAGLPIRGTVRLAETEAAGPAGSGEPSARFPEPFSVEGRVRSVGEVIHVAGHVAGMAVLTCDRCLAPVDWPLSFEFEARYAPQSAAPKQHAGRAHEAAVVPERPGRSDGGARTDARLGDDAGIRLEADELDISFLAPGTHVLVVEDVVREQVLLELPLRTLCKDDCRGLCPRCGDDLNAGACRCGGADEPGDLRFAALADLKKKLEQN